LFGVEIGCPMALEFLGRWSNLGKLKQAKPAALRSFFYKHNSRSEEKIQARLDAIKNAVALTEDSMLIGVLQVKVLCLLRQIAAVQKSIEQFDARIEKTFRLQANASLFAELPGAGSVLAPRLAAVFGTRQNNWLSAEDLQRFSGVAPVRKQSGKKNDVRFRRARPIFVHQSVIEFAKCSITFCDWARLLYEHHLNKGKGKFAAIRSVAFKWLRIIFRCWKNNVSYDEIKYLRSLQRKGVKLYESLYADLPPQPAA